MTETITCQECGALCLTYNLWAEHNSLEHPEEYLNVVYYTEIFDVFWQYEQEYGFDNLHQWATKTNDLQEEYEHYLNFRQDYKAVLEKEEATLN